MEDARARQAALDHGSRLSDLLGARRRGRGDAGQLSRSGPFLLARSSPAVERVFWYDFQNDGTTARRPNSISASSGWTEPKPAYQACRTMIVAGGRSLAGGAPDRRQHLRPELRGRPGPSARRLEAGRGRVRRDPLSQRPIPDHRTGRREPRSSKSKAPSWKSPLRRSRVISFPSWNVVICPRKTMTWDQAQKACICEGCPSFVSCAEKLAYCMPEGGKSRCIEIEAGWTARLPRSGRYGLRA